jgi:hypothetical protein
MEEIADAGQQVEVPTSIILEHSVPLMNGAL